MYRKLSGGNGRRSSLLRISQQRVSSMMLEAAEEKKDVKKSMIPRPSNRASSVEDVNSGVTRASSVDTHRERLRSQSVECLPGFSDKVMTPRLKAQTPGSVMTTTKRTARKDTRVLSDKEFQRKELSKIREYLHANNLLEHSEIQDIGTKMSLKLFVNVMNVLLQTFFPDLELNMSNYLESVPFLLKKLKYPGKVTRSMLITANTGCSWQHVLGIMSWLVNLLCASKLTWCEDEDEILGPEKIDKMMSCHATRFREWRNRGDIDVVNQEDKDFFRYLVADKKVELEAKEVFLRDKLMNLQKLMDDPVVTAEMAQCQQQKARIKLLEESLNNEKGMSQALDFKLEKLQSKLQKCERKSEDMKQKLSKGEEIKKQILEKYESQEAFVQHIYKTKSELKTKKHRFQFQSARIDNINSRIYKDELCIARAKTLLDKESFIRDAFVRELGHEYPDVNNLQVSFSYAHADAPKHMKEYKVFLEQTIHTKKKSFQETEGKGVALRKEVSELKEDIMTEEESYELLMCEKDSIEKQMQLSKDTDRIEMQQLNRKEMELKLKAEKLLNDIDTVHKEIETKNEELQTLKEKNTEMKKKYEEAHKTFSENLTKMHEFLRAHTEKCIKAQEEILKC